MPAARVQKEKHLENQNVTWTQNNIFDFLNVRHLSPEGFFTFLVVVAHGAARGGGGNGRKALGASQRLIPRALRM